MAAVPNRLHEVAARDPAPWEQREQRDVIFRSEHVQNMSDFSAETKLSKLTKLQSSSALPRFKRTVRFGSRAAERRSCRTEALLPRRSWACNRKLIYREYIVPNQRVGLAISRPNEYQPCQASPPASSWIALAEGECLIVFSVDSKGSDWKDLSESLLLWLY